VLYLETPYIPLDLLFGLRVASKNSLWSRTTRCWRTWRGHVCNHWRQSRLQLLSTPKMYSKTLCSCVQQSVRHMMWHTS